MGETFSTKDEKGCLDNWHVGNDQKGKGDKIVIEEKTEEISLSDQQASAMCEDENLFWQVACMDLEFWKRPMEESSGPPGHRVYVLPKHVCPFGS